MPPLTLYNTLTKTKEPLRAADPARVTFYTCGPTVYDDAHIGNFRSFLAADLLRRWIESPLCTIQADDGSDHTGPRTVAHMLNITDVGHMTDDDLPDGGGEDKMQAATKRLLDQKKAGTAHAAIDDPHDPKQIADFYAERFISDAERLGIKVAAEARADPSVMPRATDHVAAMVSMIEDLADKGFAYRPSQDGEASDAVYFSVQAFETYGRLSGNTIEHLRGGAGGRVQDRHQAGKRHPADFLLWKSDESHLLKWPGPTIGGVTMPDGYPGWHIECSVMSLALGTTVDIHSGGEDNIFPHHECERAQSCCAHGTEEFARHWFHPRFLLVNGEKMSKSKGNFFTARELFDRHEPAAVRLELIKTHYRANANFTEQGLKDSGRIIDRWRRFSETATADGPPTDPAVQSRFTQAMSDDLNIAQALGHINSWIASIQTPTRADAEQLLAFDETLGLLTLDRPKQAQTDIGLFTGGLEPDDTVIEKLIARRDAKRAKDFATSDAIRDELAAMGYAIKDVAGGQVEVSRA